MGAPAALAFSESAALLVLGAALAAICVSLRRQLPRHNVLAAVALAAAFFWMLETVNADCDWPFGPRTAFQEMPLPGGTPLACVWLWVAGLFGSRLLARRLLRPWRKTRRYGYWMALIAALLMALLYRVAAPVKIEAVDDYWLHQLATFGVSLVSLLVVAPWLIVKSAHPPPADWLGPAVWLALCAYLGLRALNQGWEHAWLAGALVLLVALGLWITHRRAGEARTSR